MLTTWRKTKLNKLKRTPQLRVNWLIQTNSTKNKKSLRMKTQSTLQLMKTYQTSTPLWMRIQLNSKLKLEVTKTLKT